MTIDQAYRFVQFCYNKQQSGNISPDQFNNIAPTAQISILNQILGNEQEYRPNQPVSRYGFLVTQKILEDIRPLIKIPSTLAFSAGVATYPSDCLYLFNIVIAGAYQPAEPIEYDESIYLINSQIKPPTVLYPKYYVLGSNIYILPSSISTSQISYVRRPAVPFWNYTIVNQQPVYNSSGSQDFELGELLHLRICQRILQFVGLNLDLPAITQLNMAMEAQGQ